MPSKTFSRAHGQRRWLDDAPTHGLSVIIPIYNERNTLPQLLERVLGASLPETVALQEVIMVDDGSTDGTREWLCEVKNQNTARVTVILHRTNRGKGAAVRTALRHATGTLCVIQDADLEYSPDDYARMLTPILDGRADVIYGSRFAGSETRRVPFFWHYLGNKALTYFSNAVTNLCLTDAHTCYKVAPTKLFRHLRLRSNGFEIDPEITAKLSRLPLSIYEVPITYVPRGYGQGKKIRLKDGFVALWSVIRHRFLP